MCIHQPLPFIYTARANACCIIVLQAAIVEQRFPEYAHDFVRETYPDGKVPDWVRLGLVLAEIPLTF